MGVAENGVIAFADVTMILLSLLRWSCCCRYCFDVIGVAVNIVVADTVVVL